MKITYCFFEETTPGNCRETHRYESEVETPPIPTEGTSMIFKGKKYKVSSVDLPEVVEVNLFPEGEEMK